jgi:NTE family protein
MKAANLSGGGTKITEEFGAIYGLHKLGFYPDIISGVSAGSVLSVPYALRRFDKMREILLNFTLRAFFKKPPVNNKGQITLGAKIRAIRGEITLGDQSNLVKTLSEVISKDDFRHYQEGRYAVCVVEAIDFRTGKKEIFNLKHTDTTYEKYLEYVLASSSIPIFTYPVRVGNKILYDGGVRDHIASEYVLNNFDVTECISIYSRPQDYKVEDIHWNPKNILDVLERTFEIINIEISKNDEKIEKVLCKEKNIPLTQIFLPKIMKSVYDTNKDRLYQSYITGIEVATKTYKGGNYGIQ